MEIKMLAEKDFSAALEIARSLPEYFNADGLVKIEKDLPCHEGYGLFDNGELVGWVSYEKCGKGEIEITWLMVSPGFQGKGMGGELVLGSLEMVKEKHKDLKICKVKTLAETIEDEGYARTRNFYRKLGFVSQEIIDPYPAWGPGNPCQIFAKEL